MRGRPPIPTTLKLVKGTARKARIKNEPRPDPLETVPKPPATIKGKEHKIAQGAWKQVARKLIGLRLLTKADLEILELYAIAYERLVLSERAISEEGITTTTDKGAIIAHPAVYIASSTRKELKGYLEQFGMTPAARTKVKAPDAKPEEQDKVFEIMKAD